MLYTTESYPAPEGDPARTHREQQSFLGKDQPWPHLATSAMTAMVVSLDLIELARELLLARNYTWDLGNYALLLSALEASHWYAFCFNENSHLRLQLQQRGFMHKGSANSARGSTELPHLLEQEILAMEQLLFTVFRLFCHNKHHPAMGTSPNTSARREGKEEAAADSNLPYTPQEAEAFAEPLVERCVRLRILYLPSRSLKSPLVALHRLSSLVLLRYLSFEEAALRRRRGNGDGNGRTHDGAHHAQQQGDDEGDSSEDEARFSGSDAGAVLSMTDFLRQKHEAYKSPALIVLEGVCDFTHAQFQHNLSWIVPLLSRLIACEDLEVRLCVRQIYQSFVNFLLIK